MRNLFILSSFVLVSFFAAGCSYDLDEIGTFDATKKTIAASPGNSDLNGAIKRMLRQNGWTILARRGDQEEEYSKINDANKAEYRLNVSHGLRDITVTFNTMYHFYEISITNNRTGVELLTMSGRRGEEDVIVRRLEEALKRNTTQPAEKKD